MSDSPIRHFTQKDLARRWNLSHRTLERWRYRGQGPAFVKVCGRVVYRQEDVAAYEADNLRRGPVEGRAAR